MEEEEDVEEAAASAEVGLALAGASQAATAGGVAPSGACTPAFEATAPTVATAHTVPSIEEDSTVMVAALVER